MTFRNHFISETRDFFKLYNPEYALYPLNASFDTV